MNDRIQELVEQSGIYFYKQSVLDKHYPELYDGVYCELSVEQLEKFAELIVKECIKVLETNNANLTLDAKWDAIYEIEQYFGVDK